MSDRTFRLWTTWLAGALVILPGIILSIFLPAAGICWTAGTAGVLCWHQLRIIRDDLKTAGEKE